jgi:DNA primase
VIDLAGYLYLPTYDPKNGTHVLLAVEALQTRGKVYIPTSETVREPTLHPSRWQKYLPIGKEARQYANQRGLSDSTIERFRLGQDRDFLTIPSFMEQRLQGIKKRAINDQAPLRYTTDKGSKQALFNADAVAYKQGPVILTKGEIPCMLLVQHGFSACAPTGGEGGWEPKWNLLLSMADVLAIADNDEAGFRFFTQRAIDLGGRVVFPPKSYKDVDEWILGDTAIALAQINSWIKEN